MAQTFSIKDTRNKLADIVSRVEITGDEVIITKFGKPRVRIVPLSTSTSATKFTLRQTFGVWKNRKDIKDTAKWSRELRGAMSTRKNE